jgi:hypothetical protein
VQRFFLRNTNAAGEADMNLKFGEKDDVPLVGNWDGK